MYPSACRVSIPQTQVGEGQGLYWHQNLPWTGGDVCAKFYQDQCRLQGFGFPLALHIPTDRQTNKHLYAHLYKIVMKDLLSALSKKEDFSYCIIFFINPFKITSLSSPSSFMGLIEDLKPIKPETFWETKEILGDNVK